MSTLGSISARNAVWGRREMRMPEGIRPDMSCVPYRRKPLYLGLTIPFLILLVSIFVYLWTFGFFLALVFGLFYLAMSFFQAYCCAHQDCPYVGGFCPAVIGIMPASLMAKLIYGDREIEKSEKRFALHATLGVLSWLGLIAFPLYWIAKLGIGFAVGYVACHVVYTVIFGLTICPACALRDICPGGKVQNLVLGGNRGKES
jgi:hypothetical protein